jgi:hypothetical protein
VPDVRARLDLELGLQCSSTEYTQEGILPLDLEGSLEIVRRRQVVVVHEDD